MDGLCCGPGYASPSEAVKAPKEKLLYSIAIYTGTGIQKPDYLATIDVDPQSSKLFKSYSSTWKCLELEMNYTIWDGMRVRLVMVTKK